MKNMEFIILLTSNTNKTHNIRTYTGHWYTGASRIPDCVTTKIGYIVGLIQAKIDQGLFCDKAKESLLVYNFQPLNILGDNLFCSIEMVIKSFDEISDTTNNVGIPFQLIVNGNTGEVMNNTKGMMEMGMITLEEAKEEELEEPKSYGKYLDYQAPCSFAAIYNYRPMNIQDIFEGKYDNNEAVQKCQIFDSLIEGNHFLNTKKELARYVAELPYPKQAIEQVKQGGLGKKAVKLIDYFTTKVFVNPDPKAQQKDDPIQDQLNRFAELTDDKSKAPVNKPQHKASQS